ncbi:hypothetical protein NFI96_005031 [Prochilodus magdalenae]|nr:hypothetical protein NFI96_005031 [Prochilodus magdalenae]
MSFGSPGGTGQCEAPQRWHLQLTCSDEGHLTLPSPSTLDANISAHNGSLVSAPAFSNNTVSGDLKIYFCKKNVAVTQNTAPLSSEDKPLAPEASSDIDSFMETIHRTPTKLQNLPLGSPGPHKTKGLHTACRSDVPRRKLSFGDDQDQDQPQPQLQLAPDEGYVEDRVSFSPSGPTPNCIMGEIIGARVRAEYLCCKCGTAALRVKADSFSVKCARCKHSWKCEKLQCRCTAEITVEQFDGRIRTIELSDSLLRSIVHFNSKGYFLQLTWVSVTTSTMVRYLDPTEVAQVDQLLKDSWTTCG